MSIEVVIHGPQGDPGKKWLQGIGVPDNALGSDLYCYYLDRQSMASYEKIAGAWVMKTAGIDNDMVDLNLARQYMYNAGYKLIE